jgi:hypothetical protein
MFSVTKFTECVIPFMFIITVLSAMYVYFAGLNIFSNLRLTSFLSLFVFLVKEMCS